jgi:putative transposase
VHPAVSCDGERAHLLNGRLLRSKRQYRNKLIARMDAKIARCKKGGKRRRKLIRAKKKGLSKLKHQIQEIEHKQTSESFQHAAPGGRREAGHWRCAYDPS